MRSPGVSSGAISMAVVVVCMPSPHTMCVTQRIEVEEANLARDAAVTAAARGKAAITEAQRKVQAVELRLEQLQQALLDERVRADTAESKATAAQAEIEQVMVRAAEVELRHDTQAQQFKVRVH